MAQRGEVRHDLAATLHVVQHDAGEAGQLAAHQDDGTLGGDLAEVLVGEPTGGQDEAVHGR